MREAQNGHVLLYFDRAEFADLSQIVSAEVYQHIVFGKFLLVREQFFFQRRIFIVVLAARACAGKRIGKQFSVLKFYKRFGGRAGDFKIASAEIKHVRRRVYRAHYAVCVKKAALKIRLKTVGKNNLKNVAFFDMLFRFFYHFAIFVFCKQRFKLRLYIRLRRLLGHAVFYHAFQIFKFFNAAFIFLFNIFRVDIYY